MQMTLSARKATRPTVQWGCSWRWPAWCSASSIVHHLGLLHCGDLARVVTDCDHQTDGARRQQRQEQQEGELQPLGTTAPQLTRQYAEHQGCRRLCGHAGDHPCTLAAATQL